MRGAVIVLTLLRLVSTLPHPLALRQEYSELARRMTPPLLHYAEVYPPAEGVSGVVLSRSLLQ
jgi:hypothetical protein